MLLLLKVLTMISLAEAQTTAVCKDRIESRENIQVASQWNSKTETCYVSVKAMETDPAMVYRDFLFSNDGLMMVFNSYGDGPTSTDTAAREFYFFPRAIAYPTFEWNNETRRLEITHVTGEKFYFDYDKANLVAISNGQVTTVQKVHPINKGGVEFPKYNGLMLDGGFSVGQSPSTADGIRPLFTDVKGTKCTVKNSDIYKYPGDGDSVFKFREDSALKTFLKTKCPSLSF
jgi:hypothetical protein